VSAIVYVWLPEPGRVGHASLQIGPDIYASFWPADAAGKGDKLGGSHEAHYPGSYKEDRRLEGGKASETVVLNDLDEAAMIEAWTELKRREARYNLVQQNCSTIVASLLETGSGLKPSFRPRINVDDYTDSLPARLLFRTILFVRMLEIWSPAAVRDYAYEIQRRKKLA
jgi:hypothetical protein